MLALDPGETTGWALFVGHRLVKAGEFKVTSSLLFDHLLLHEKPQQLVIENYKVYAHRAAQHIGSEVPTIQYIGMLKYLAAVYDIPLTLQMAFQAKKFVTDNRLVDLGLWHTSKHARDAIRHGVYWILFGRQ